MSLSMAMAHRLQVLRGAWPCGSNLGGFLECFAARGRAIKPWDIMGERRALAGNDTGVRLKEAWPFRPGRASPHLWTGGRQPIDGGRGDT